MTADEDEISSGGRLASLEGRRRQVLIIGSARCRREHQTGNTSDYECVLGVPHQEFEKDDACPPGSQTHNHQNVRFHFFSKCVRNFF